MKFLLEKGLEASSLTESGQASLFPMLTQAICMSSQVSLEYVKHALNTARNQQYYFHC